MDLWISQKEIKRALALQAHLEQLQNTICDHEGQLLRPIDMDHAKLVLASASLRALVFDNEPMLLRFADDHDISPVIESLETNLALLLWSWLSPDTHHVSDLLFEILLDPAKKEAFPPNELKQVLLGFHGVDGFRGLLERPELWVPNEQNDAIGYGPGRTQDGAPAQLFDVTRRHVSLKDWGRLRIGYLKDIQIDRKNLVSYVANKLGGVHYDSGRLPSADEDIKQFRTLATAYDWDNQAIMHAGFVGVGWACLELMTCPEIAPLAANLRGLHIKRQGRLLEGRDITSEDQINSKT